MNDLRWMHELVRVEPPRNMVAWSCEEYLDDALGDGWEHRDVNGYPEMVANPRCDFCERSGQDDTK